MDIAINVNKWYNNMTMIGSYSYSPDMILMQDAVQAAYDARVSLGEHATDKVRANQFGDIAMEADIQAEESMVRVLREAGVEARIEGEEVGTLSIELGKGTVSRLVVMDGLDGSSVYPKGDLCGSMIAIFEADKEPTYGNVSAAAISLDALGKAIIAGKNKGAFLIDLNDPTAAAEAIATSQGDIRSGDIFVDEVREGLNPSDRLFGYFDGNRRVFGDRLRSEGFSPRRLGSSAAHYSLLALGQATVVGEATRKRNLEFPAAFRVVTEAGGAVVIASTGESLRGKNYYTFGQQEHIPVLTAANNDILNRSLDAINKR